MPQGGYANMTVQQLLTETHPYWRNKFEDPVLEKAIAYVEAENIFAVRALISEWFTAIESGEAETRDPDPFDNSVSQERADTLIQELDSDFDIENYRWGTLGVTKGPEYSRLSPKARIAFAQAVFKILKNEDVIIAEACTRLNNGEELPPNYPFEYRG